MTDPVLGLAPRAAASDVTRVKDASKDVLGAARQFESLLVEQMLKSMRESSGGGWMGTGEDQAGGALMEYAEQELSRVIAAGGGFGLAQMISQGLARDRDGGR
jgi:Rod binding domain-containing protein